MTGALRALATRRHALVALAWAACLLWLVRSGRFRDFLVPGFGPILGAAYLALVALLVAETFRAAEAARPGAELLSALTLLVPIAFLAHARGARLEGEAFARRAVGTPTVAAPPAARPPPAAPARSGADTAAAAEVTLLELYQRPADFQGKRVAVVGMCRRHAPARQEFGPDALLVYRFAVSCCAADAQPLAVVVQRRPGQAEPPDDAWVRVEGRFTLKDAGRGQAPLLEAASLAPAAEPSTPYLH